ncbi:MAG: UDP-N-acetylmuramoyl-L-alanine--D-glutamate ligase [Bacteroidota bacterium]
MKKRIAILGAGESGIGAAILAQQKGFDVWVSDKGKIKEKYKSVLCKYDIKWEEEKHSLAEILSAVEVIKSPGIPDKAEIINAINGKGISIISEIEFAGRYTNAKKICITGSNGKTTTTSLLGDILKREGLKVCVAGNIGNSFAWEVASGNEYDFYVLEISSFQLDGMFDFKADIAIITNITPDHIDRYDYKFENYVNSKMRITRNMTETESLIYCYDDLVLREQVEKLNLKCQLYPFSIKQELLKGAYLNNDIIIIQTKEKEELMSIESLALQGKHNVYNSMAAGIGARLFEVRKTTTKESFSDYQGIEHRLENVLNVHGIEFINDSKATNVNSTWYALECMKKPVVLIIGGVDKGNDYEFLKQVVTQKVKGIVCLGNENTSIIKAFSDLGIPIVETQSMRKAVNTAYVMARNEDVVLLSPACASFDLFENYEDRGRQFKAAVREL